ncbi:MAG TPA: CopD family protein [Gemmatimonadaceae bacterium]
MQAPLIDWADPPRELAGFVAQFLAAGAIGFRYFALRGRRIETDRAFYDDAARRAAVIGLVGVLMSVLLAVAQVPSLAARRHVSVAALVTTDASTALQVAFLALALVGFALAIGRLSLGWPLAATSVVAGSLRAVFLGKWASAVNPVHVLAAGLWIGTLFVLVTAGLTSLLRHEPTRDRRGAIAADMVNGFSPLALTMGGVVVLFGVITAWRHLHVLANLWSTPYGYTLIAKLCFVALVFGLGAWNWRRQRPTLGSEAAATSIRRSATTELTVAAIVLLITAVLVSLPSPRPPGAAGSRPGQEAAAH